VIIYIDQMNAAPFLSGGAQKYSVELADSWLDNYTQANDADKRAKFAVAEIKHCRLAVRTMHTMMRKREGPFRIYSS
jgi:hypothetical protein